MKGGLAASSALALALHAASLPACPCQGSSGPGAALTTQMQQVGASLTDTVRLVHGAWDPDGDYDALGDGSMQWLVDYALALGYRPVRPLELGMQLAYGWQSVSSPAFSSERRGFGDTRVSARWEAVDEAMPYETIMRPALALVGALRMPTGTVARVDDAGRGGLQSGTTGAVGATASSQGLGTWEPSLAADLQQRVWHRRIQLNLTGEIAVRAADDAIGIDRRLGPRVLGVIAARYIPSAYWGLGAMTDMGWEGDVAFDGTRRAGTGQRLWTVSAFGYIAVRDTNLRSGILLRYAPPVDGVSVNAVGAASLAVSLGYAR